MQLIAGLRTNLDSRFIIYSLASVGRKWIQCFSIIWGDLVACCAVRALAFEGRRETARRLKFLKHSYLEGNSK